MLGSCYQSNESHSFVLLNRKSPFWDTNCFQMGIDVESHSFFKHEGLEVGPSLTGWFSWYPQLSSATLSISTFLLFQIMKCVNSGNHASVSLESRLTRYVQGLFFHFTSQSGSLTTVVKGSDWSVGGSGPQPSDVKFK